MSKAKTDFIVSLSGFRILDQHEHHRIPFNMADTITDV